MVPLIEEPKNHLEYLKSHYLQKLKRLTSGVVTMDQVVKELVENHLDLESRAAYDGLIPYFLNNLGFTKALDRELKTVGRNGVKAGVILALDIDRLKRFNDTLGHGPGDKLIITYARIIDKHTRSSDLRGRLGGDEFAIYLVGSNLENARRIAERIRRGIIKAVRETFPTLSWQQTISIGLSLAKKTDTAQSLRDRADKALYKAKKERNRVIIAPRQSGPTLGAA